MRLQGHKICTGAAMILYSVVNGVSSLKMTNEILNGMSSEEYYRRHRVLRGDGRSSTIYPVNVLSDDDSDVGSSSDTWTESRNQIIDEPEWYRSHPENLMNEIGQLNNCVGARVDHAGNIDHDYAEKTQRIMDDCVEAGIVDALENVSRIRNNGKNDDENVCYVCLGELDPADKTAPFTKAFFDAAQVVNKFEKKVRIGKCNRAFFLSCKHDQIHASCLAQTLITKMENTPVQRARWYERAKDENQWIASECGICREPVFASKRVHLHAQNFEMFDFKFRKVCDEIRGLMLEKHRFLQEMRHYPMSDTRLLCSVRRKLRYKRKVLRGLIRNSHNEAAKEEVNVNRGADLSYRGIPRPREDAIDNASNNPRTLATNSAQVAPSISESLNTEEVRRPERLVLSSHPLLNYDETNRNAMFGIGPWETERPYDATPAIESHRNRLRNLDFTLCASRLCGAVCFVTTCTAMDVALLGCHPMFKLFTIAFPILCGSFYVPCEVRRSGESAYNINRGEYDHISFDYCCCFSVDPVPESDTSFSRQVTFKDFDVTVPIVEVIDRS